MNAITTVVNEALESVDKLNKDVRTAAGSLSCNEARFLVDLYYQMQDQRIRNDAQVRAMAGAGEPNETFMHFGANFEKLENQAKVVLDRFVKNQPAGEWLLGVHGIGPVLAAGLLANIDITKAPTVGHIWGYAGLNTNQNWIGAVGIKDYISGLVKQEMELDNIARSVAEKIGQRYENFIRLCQIELQKDGKESLTRAVIEKIGSRRPWNNGFKVLAWKVSQSFVMMSAQKCAYRRIYDERKAKELVNNANGMYADQAAEKLKIMKDKTTNAYKAYSIGQLPLAHINARCERYAVKQFLSDLHAVMYKMHYGVDAPIPYPVAHMGHAHIRPIGESN